MICAYRDMKQGEKAAKSDWMTQSSSPSEATVGFCKMNSMWEEMEYAAT